MTMSDGIKRIEGSFAAPQGARFAIAAARFNELIVERLIEGALDTLQRHGVPAANILLAKAPGSFELPLLCQRIAASGQVEAVIALGCVIRGGTPHFEYVAGEVAKGCSQVATSTGVPVCFGVLTTDNIDQAIERAGTKAGNKGSDAALAAIEMVNLARLLGQHGY
jgi:6,7-dimethyl-8-ribityllumazine synthase